MVKFTYILRIMNTFQDRKYSECCNKTVIHKMAKEHTETKNTHKKLA